MRVYLSGAALAAAMFAAACGGGAGDQLASACKDSDESEMTDAACDCFAARAKAELTPEQQATLLEIVRGDGEEEGPTEEQFELAFFVAAAATECQAANN